VFNTCLHDVTLPYYDLKRIEICRSISELYLIYLLTAIGLSPGGSHVKVYFNTCAFVDDN